MSISKKKWEELNKRMHRLGISEDDLVEKFILSSGRGGQKIQKTHSCVYLKHLPTKEEVKCQKDRSQDANRFYARRLLCEKLEEKYLKEKSEKQKAIEKIRRQKRKRTRRQKQKMLEEKKRLSEKKELRKPPIYRDE